MDQILFRYGGALFWRLPDGRWHVWFRGSVWIPIPAHHWAQLDDAYAKREQSTENDETN